MIQPFAPDQRGWPFADPLQHPVVICGSVSEALPAELHISEEERARAGRFVPREARFGFLLQHHLLRSYLSHWLNLPPAELCFVNNSYGKPALDHSGLHFNISRSGRSLAFYFGPVAGGIDVEEHQSAQPFQMIVETQFHPNERATVQNGEGFFAVWTRKEALLKAIGTGLTDDLASFDCTPDHVKFSGQTYALTTFETPTLVISLALSDAGTKAPLCFNL